MKKILMFTLLIIIGLSLCGCLNTANSSNYENLYLVELNSKYGFINDKGKTIIQPQYDFADNFSEGYAAVKKNGRYGYININGDFTIAPVYIRALDFHEGLASVMNNENEWLVINSKSKVQMKGLSNSIKFSSGLADLTSGDKCGYIDKKGDWQIHPRYSYCYNFANGSATVKTEDGKYAIINKDGKFIFGPQENQLLDFVNNAVIMYEKISDDKEITEMKCVYLDTHGQKILDPFELGYSPVIDDDGGCSEFSDGLLLVSDKNLYWNYMDKNGKIVLKTKFKGIPNGHDAPVGGFINGFAYFNDTEKWGFINKQGEIIFESSEYSGDNINPNWGSFQNGLTYVYKDNKEGYINQKGEFIWSKPRKENR
ncbi:MAG: WG repeat-containing protein [Heliobacteriaceae bacterium]|jgi:hypothetical protein|nr:WG repeat-containing protein [Heliobacteriaceae bacterium]